MPPTPRPRQEPSTRLFIWLFGGLLVLLTGYQLLRHQPQRFEPPPSSTSAEIGTDAPPSTGPDLVEVPPPDRAGPTTAETGPDVIGPSPSDLPDDEKVYTYVEQMPQPPGGTEDLLQYLDRNVKYPALALRNQVEGKVFVNFIVRTDGQLSNFNITKGIGAGCDEEAIRVLRQMPRWSPGKQNGRAVNVSYTVPVTFAVQ
ncbi:energy transducer TonB [Hymenobacter gummosus]|uniref:Energy transducer TonB n=1 Tax=Hymenobacter gummosus TaxID=1776032 RepID=A0A431U9Q9_9BACT|nr:energy transducer TonB [Hymenobacter gummosus]RTQ53685.1 energy transducer TonB [Hymenobacter gummosus]